MMKEKIREPRLWMLVLFYFLGLLNFITASVDITDERMKAMISDEVLSIISKSFGFYDLVKEQDVWSAVVFSFLPVIIAVCILALDKKIMPKITYLIGSVIGIIFNIIVFWHANDRVKKWVEYFAFYGSDAKHREYVVIKNKPAIGFWIILGLYIVLAVWTLIKDFALNKKALKEHGIKGAIASIAEQTTKGLNFENGEIGQHNGQQGPKVSEPYQTEAVRHTSQDYCDSSHHQGANQSQDMIPCPTCGKMIALDAAFCTYCGTKLIDDLIQKNESIQNESNQVQSKSKSKRMTVAEYISNMSGYTCDNCGEIINGNEKYCPVCGKAVVIKVMPDKCNKCGKILSNNFSFCPYCSEKIIPIVLQKKCKNCSSDLIFGKEFCINCGTRVGD